MTEGVSLVVSEVETADLPSHKLWMDVLHCKDQLHRAQGPLKINVSTCGKCSGYCGVSIFLCRLERGKLNAAHNSGKRKGDGGGSDGGGMSENWQQRGMRWEG